MQVVFSRLSRKHLIAFFLSLALVLGVFFLVRGLDSGQIKGALARLSPKAVGAALALVLAQILFQATRFWFLIPGSRRPAWKLLFSAFSIGQWVNLFAPARAGDVMKVVLLSSDGRGDLPARSPRLSVVDSTAALIADKLVDVLGLLVLLLTTGSLLTLGNPERLAQLLPGAACGLGLALILAHSLRGRIASAFPRISELSGRIAGGLSVLREPKVLAGALGLSLLSWLAECFALNCLCEALGFQLPLSGLVTTLGILNLGIAIPLSFANLGPFEAAMAFSLSRFQVPLSEALVIASAHHLLQILGVTILAFLSYLRGVRGRGVSSGDKSRALRHYASMAGQYNSNVEKGLLRPLRERERGMVLGFAGFESFEGRGARSSSGAGTGSAAGASGPSMIDVGCGGGFYALAAKQAGFRVCAVDAVPEMVEALRDRVDRVEVADVESMNATDRYDLVICAGVLDFTSDPTRAIRNLFQLVAPGGKLVLLAPRSGPGGLLYRLEKWFVGISVNCFSRAWWEEQAAANGFVLARLGHPLPTNSVVEFHPLPGRT